jgi:hypothetical protein
MPITADDLKFFASTKLTDDDDAGGPRTATVVQDGLTNNLWPDFSEPDRLAGRAQVRKLYPSVVDAGSDALLGARLTINDPPANAATSVTLFGYGNDATLRKAFVDAVKAGVALLPVSVQNVTPFNSAFSASAAYELGTDVLTVFNVTGSTVQIAVGDTLAVTVAGVTQLHKAISASVVSGATEWTLEPPLPTGSGTVSCAVRRIDFPGPRPYAAVATAALAAAAATTIDLSTLWVRVAPVNPALAYPTAELATGIGSGWAQYTHGQMQCVQPGDLATISHEAAMTPATLAALDVVDTLRTDLAQLTVVGNDGSVIARFVRNGVVPSGVGCTADLAAGTLTVSDVTGWSQPVTVRHRIAETVAVQSLTGLTATLVAGLGREYPSGAQFTTEVPLGDLQPGVGAAFHQQAWTKVWSDAVIGVAVAALYTGAIDVTTGGTENDRWAVVFTSSTQFNLISERRGQIAAGNTATDFIPLNPDTGEPFFTLYAAGWVSPGLGNVMRFNTTGAYAATWGIRSRYPDASAGGDAALLRLRGDV